MRSVVSEDSRVGLLLFDEPSASLDPVAEHGRFSGRVIVVRYADQHTQIFLTGSESCGATRLCSSRLIDLAT